jgi:hypothetical protein
MGFAVTSYQDEAVGILSAKIVALDQTLNFPESVTQLKVDEDRYEMFKEPATKIDANILSRFVDPINVAKQNVVNKGTIDNFWSNYEVYGSESAAINQLDAIYGNFVNSNGLYSNREANPLLVFTSSGLGTHPPAGNFSAGIAVTDAGGGSGKLLIDFSPVLGVSTVCILTEVTSTFSSGVGNTIFFGTPGVAYTHNDGVNFIASGEIYEDVDVMHFHPNLEPPDPGVDDIFGNSSNIILTSSNKGIGFANTFFPNGLNTSTSAPSPNLNTFVQSVPEPPFIGKVFTFSTTSSPGDSVIVSIGNSQKIIENLRVGVSTNANDVGVGSFNGASVIVKGQKKSHAVNTWSGKRMRVVAGENKTSFQAAIEILTDPSYQE